MVIDVMSIFGYHGLGGQIDLAKFQMKYESLEACLVG